MEKYLEVIERLLAASADRVEADDGNRAMKLTQAALNAANALQLLDHLDLLVLLVERTEKRRNAQS